MAMITKPTVLVLGAGASVDVGYPTGEALTNRICIKLSEKNNSYKSSSLFLNALTAGFEQQYILEFGRRFFKSQVLSVDDFLLHNPQFRDIGKFCIAHELIEIEDEDDLLTRGRNSWYRLIRLAIGNGLEQLQKTPLRIITFNYDRSLQHFLFTAFAEVAGPVFANVVPGLVNRLVFLPIHGTLQPLPWYDPSGRPYKSLADPNRIKEVSRNILIADESENRRYMGHAPWDLIGEAEQVLFLGFGFLPSNMEKLGLRRLADTKRIGFGGSAMGLTSLQIDALRKEFDFRVYDDIPTLFQSDVFSNPIKRETFKYTSAKVRR